jgi:MFS family permease
MSKDFNNTEFIGSENNRKIKGIPDNHHKTMEIADDIPKFLSRIRFWKLIIALSITTIAISVYGQMESQWFNSFMTNIAGYTDYHKSAMVATSAIVGTIFFLIWAAYSDNLRTRLGRRLPILIIGFLSTALFVSLFGVSTNFWWLWLCDGVLIGITSNMFHMANRTLIPDLFPLEKRGKANTFLSIANFAGIGAIWVYSFIALPDGGGSYTRDQYGMIFGFVAVFLCIAAFTSLFLIREPKIDVAVRSWTQDLRQMFDKQEMGKYSTFLRLFLASLFTIMASNAYNPWMLEIIQELNFEDEESIVGAIFIGIGVLIVLPTSARLIDRIGRKKMLYIMITGLIVGCIIVAFSNYVFLVYMFGFALVLSCTMGLDIALSTWTQDLLPRQSRARFLGIINIGKAAGQVPGVFLAAFFSETFGTLSIFFVSALFLIVSIPLFRRVPETLKPLEKPVRPL